MALLKLSSEFDLDVFQSILKNSLSDGVLLDDARSWVSARKRFYAVAVLDWFAGRPKDAMSAWDRYVTVFTGSMVIIFHFRLVEKEIVDESFPDTLDFIVELLLECPNRSLVIDGCQLLLKHDEKAAIKVSFNFFLHGCNFQYLGSVVLHGNEGRVVGGCGKVARWQTFGIPQLLGGTCSSTISESFVVFLEP